MEKDQQEKSGLFTSFADSLSPVLFSEEEDNGYDSLNPTDKQENTVLIRNDRSSVHCMSSEDSPYSPSSNVYKSVSRSDLPSCSESEEETELSYNSPTLLLEISSSSSSNGIREENNWTDNYEGQDLDFGAWTKPSSDCSSECECSNCDSQSTGQFKWKEHNSLAAVTEFTYKYYSVSVEMTRAVHSLRYPAEINKWAIEYVNQQGIRRTYPVQKKRQQYLECAKDQSCACLLCDVPGNSS
ncbi:uncharacterized protein LOC122923369 isoform X2 [Bufo gargarizans]|uniref:uncharacterized protein LOC122923369 isoform X2 n=1 Tax=Bufo gargarizans TaxID=30331 RepID=UPI001CF346B0|nr:uncharacterized protein LOC122923369 isoform X2 [Bufo gargarizans]